MFLIFYITYLLLSQNIILFFFFLRNRSTLVKLINDLSGLKDTTLDNIDNMSSTGTNSDTEVELSPGLDQEKPISTSSMIENDKKEYNINDSNVKLENNLIDQKNNAIEKPINLKRKLVEEDDDLQNTINVPIVGEEIEESVMIVKGEGLGNECDTGNPDEINTQNETSKNEDVKKPKLWSIETICSSSKENPEEIISVPKSGFFFGDDSVPCFNNVSNGQSSHPDENKLDVEPSEIKDKESKKLDEISSTSILHTTKDELSSKTTLKQSVFNIKVHEEEIQITERNANDVFTKSEFIEKDNVFTTNVNESLLVESIKEKQSTTCEISNKYNIDCNINENKSDKYKVDCNNEELNYKIENDLSNNQPLDQANSDIDKDKQITEQDNMSINSEENVEDKTEQQLTNIIGDQIIKTDEHIIDNNINEPSTSVIKPSIDIENVDDSCEKTNKNELLVNTVDIHEQKSIDIMEKNSCELEKTMLLNNVDSDIINDNHILIDDCNIIDKKETIINLDVEDNKNKQLSEDIVDHIQTTDYSKSNSVHSNYDQQTIKEIDSSSSLLCTIDCSNNTEIHDQTIVTNVKQCLTASNQINDDQNYKKSKKTSHNISNIIKTNIDVISDCTKINRQSTIINVNENILLDNCKIKNEINFVNICQKEKSLGNVDCPIISNNKHNLDKILQKSDDVKEIPSLNYEKESTKEYKLNNKVEPTNVEMVIKMDKTDTENTEANIQELKTKNIDISNELTVEREYGDGPIENEKNNVLLIPSVHEKEPIIETIQTISNIDENNELSTISIIQSSEEIKQEHIKIDCTQIKLNKSKNEKELMIDENKSDYINEKELNSKELKNDLCNNTNMHDLSVYKRSLEIETPMVIDEGNNDEIVQVGKLRIEIKLILSFQLL